MNGGVARRASMTVSGSSMRNRPAQNQMNSDSLVAVVRPIS